VETSIWPLLSQLQSQNQQLDEKDERVYALAHHHQTHINRTQLIENHRFYQQCRIHHHVHQREEYPQFGEVVCISIIYLCSVQCWRKT